MSPRHVSAPAAATTATRGRVIERAGEQLDPTHNIPPAPRQVKAPSVASVLDQALMLAARGLPCFPCGTNKCPTTPHGFLDASADLAAVRNLWATHPGELVGVRTGATSGLDVLDIDRKHEQAARWWSAHRDRLRATRVHRTRSGGLHLLFEHAPGLRCSASKIVPGVDVRGDGGYIIWWPAAELPVLCEAPVAPWPAWLLMRLVPQPRPVPPPTGVTVPDPHALAQLARLVADAPEGRRNALAFWAACRAGEMVASGLLSMATAVAVITEAAICAGLPRTEAERTARSGVHIGGGLGRAR
jgi:hypothetical protein